MPRTARVAPGGMVFHVLNRGAGRMQLSRANKDYDAFRRVLEETLLVCAHAHLCLLLATQPLAFRNLARTRRRPFPIYAANDQHAHAAVATGQVPRGLRAFVPGPLQVVSSAKRRTLLCRGAVRGAECARAPGSSSEQKTGRGEACINGHARQAGRYWAIGPCRSRPTGPSTSTLRKRKQSFR